MSYTDAEDMGRFTAADLLDPENARHSRQGQSQRQSRARDQNGPPEDVEATGIAVFGRKFHRWASVKDLSFCTDIVKGS
ncbi:uncharacterized protein PV09_05010 [Verruconis gallopava]|uniref:Uncharacterized protein n=1 Tax=Verruconis gallopava TaxID=253628 RepID=A0A0D2AAS0_9PEZI|nr:uncharacterized protein PV09_05010 [Verruconis gallopava]KIW03695.1 hypothetical protein PV09_05010 [Verruconis gallopava]